jgi:NAD(P)H dehydrogenase (quinone)
MPDGGMTAGLDKRAGAQHSMTFSLRPPPLRKDRAMPKILIVYYSRTGNTRKMAELIAKAAQDGGGEVTLKTVADARLEDLQAADAIVLGSPTYYGHSAGPMRTFLDSSVKLHGRLAGKVGAAFASSHNIGGGNETTVLDLLHALLIHGMIVQGNAGGDHYGPVSIGAPDARAAEQCRELGANVVALLKRLRPPAA